MNCPNCGAATYEDNLGRWFCSAQCGWNSGYTYTIGERDELSELRSADTAERHGGMVVLELRVARRGCTRTHSGTVDA